MGKEAKTNAMRILERKKLRYEPVIYECDEFIDGLHTAQLTGAPVEASFKTLVTRGKSGAYYVAVIPIAEEIDLKKFAAEVEEKSVSLLAVKELLPLTGYVRGGCSPIGMKKQFRTLIEQSAEGLAQIYVSGGRIGLSLKMKPEDLCAACGGTYADIIRSEA